MCESDDEVTSLKPYVGRSAFQLRNKSVPFSSYETFTSVSSLLLDLSEDLNGKHRDIALAIHQLSELGVLLTARLLDREAPRPG